MSNYRDKELDTLSQIFKALSNPNRLKIYLRLISCCQPGTISEIHSEQCACVGELGQDLGIVPSTVSHHIKELRQAGLIHMKRQGQKMECWVSPETLELVRGFFSEPHQQSPDFGSSL